MAFPLAADSGGIRVPRWFVAAASAAITLIGAGIVYGRASAARDAHDQIVDYRLCRIEHALSIEPWQGCPPEPPQMRGGGPTR
jgi:hypothetical protein